VTIRDFTTSLRGEASDLASGLAVGLFVFALAFVAALALGGT
jgi:hypothetical protein